jgi:hypothetical protein
MPSLFEARCRLPTSANCVTSTCGHEPRLSFLAGTVASTTFRFLRAGALSLAGAAARGEPCIRPVSTTPLPVTPACVGFPDLDTAATAPPPNAFRRRCVVTIDAHESEDRVKDASAGAQVAFLQLPLRPVRTP